MLLILVLKECAVIQIKLLKMLILGIADQLNIMLKLNLIHNII